MKLGTPPSSAPAARWWLALLLALVACAAPAPPAPPTVMSSAPTPPAAAPRATRPALTSAPAPTSAPTPARLAAPTATALLSNRIIDPASVASLRPLRQIGEGRALNAALAPDKRLLAVATSAGVALLALPALQPARFDAIAGGVRAVAFRADGQALIITHTDGATETRRVADGALLAPPTAPLPSATPRAGVPPRTSPDGQTLAVLTKQAIELRRAADNAPLRSIALDDPPLRWTDLAWSADGTLIRAVAGEGVIRTWRAADGQVVADTAIQAGALFNLSAQGALVYTLNPGGDAPANLMVLRASDGKPLYDGFEAEVAASLDETLVAIVQSDGRVSVTEVATNATQSIELPGGDVLAISADGSTLALAAADWLPDLRLWSIADGALLPRPSSRNQMWEQLREVRFAPDGKTGITVSAYDYLGVQRGAVCRMWDANPSAAAETRWQVRTPDGEIPPLATCSPTQRTLVWVDVQQHAWMRVGDEPPRALPALDGATALALSPDGTQVLAGNVRGELITLALAAPDAPIVQATGVGAVRALAWSADGTSRAAWLADGALFIFTDNGLARQIAASPVAAPRDADAPAPAVQITRDGQIVITSDGRTITFYRTADGQRLRQISVAARAIAIGPGQRLLATVQDGRATLWGVP